LVPASLQSSGSQRTAEYLPLLKWSRKQFGPSSLHLLALLSDQVFGCALKNSPRLNFDDFKTSAIPAAKSSKQLLAADTLCNYAA
jgi:hypothetical protein